MSRRLTALLSAYADGHPTRFLDSTGQCGRDKPPIGAAGKYEDAVKDMKTAADLGFEPAKEFLESHTVKPKTN